MMNCKKRTVVLPPNACVEEVTGERQDLGDVIPPVNYLTRRPPPQGFPRAAGTFVVEVCTGVGTKMNRTTTENLYSEIEDRHQ